VHLRPPRLPTINRALVNEVRARPWQRKITGGATINVLLMLQPVTPGNTVGVCMKIGRMVEKSGFSCGWPPEFISAKLANVQRLGSVENDQYLKSMGLLG
jgi:hypothetical protein